MSVPRRGVLKGAAAAGGAVVAGGFAVAAADGAATGDPDRTIAFHGEHQAGITTPRQQYAAFLAADRFI